MSTYMYIGTLTGQCRCSSTLQPLFLMLLNKDRCIFGLSSVLLFSEKIGVGKYAGLTLSMVAAMETATM